ncbi:HlyD family efflux transporter periplasmic adaptor subunit [Alteromonas aestuariivivens]|uniref:HlyD family efflux transporter periplasmic adaptor subunit n=1 Tax=Alteromonas aestuariivivens TaxID=1938339 RepID=A0A3D8M8H5_9ALTE|nr:efflux RND transporter periplasmic adaptor subunit [Alteromonas aestuariivivens]RDV25988.1 HlyD family efflux transporter periplasmic adaptor subunit [Alteromonas aestuariivivens]
MQIADTSGQDTPLVPNTRKRPFLWAGFAGLIVVSATYVVPAVTQWGKSEASVPHDRLRIATVRYGDLVRDLSVQGRVVAAISPKLYSPAQGTITLQVDAGDKVKKDQILATIDSPELTNELEQQQAVVDELTTALERQKIQSKIRMLADQKAIDLARVSLTAADREKRRADAAFATHTISTIDYEKAQDDLQNAKLVHEHAVADAQLNAESLTFEIQSKTHQLNRQTYKVADLTRQVQQLTLRSPVDGIVGNLAVEQKNQLDQNQVVLSVVDLSEFELEVAIPESYADDLAIGMNAEVVINGRAYPAQLITISPEVENNQVTGRVRFLDQTPDGELVNTPEGLRQNQRLTTRILLESKPQVLMVQRGQFLDSGAGRVAYKIDGDSAYRVQITTGVRSMSDIEILSGLEANDRIIVSDTAAFKGAQTVLITD